jgi:hypothetical protein
MNIEVPTLNDNISDFDWLFKLSHMLNDLDMHIVFEFNKCHFLRPNAVAFLGGLARLIENSGREVTFRWDTLKNKAVLNNLKQNGFAGVFGLETESGDGNSIPYREDHKEDSNGVCDYLTDYWLGKGWVHVSKRLRDAIVGKVYEIYNNSFEHSGCQIGLFSCGQHFVKVNTLSLCVVDFGCGIVKNVREYLSKIGEDNIKTDANCLEWAFILGNSTQPQTFRRGLGLDLIKRFVQINNGKLEVFSNGAYALIDNNGEQYQDSACCRFNGTLIYITLICNEAYYKFADEVDVE